MKARLIREISDIFICDFNRFDAELHILEKIKTHDEYTYLHSLNVARLSVGLGKRLAFDDEQITDLGWAALLHDIGKLHVPIDVLNKAKKLTQEERTVMQSHPVESLTEIARSTPTTVDRLRRLAAAFEHHQRYDLQGYPVVINKLSLHPFSRIVSIADTFDAMTTDRIYQRRVLPDVALKLLAQGFGTVFDPVVLQAFITSMGAFPVGSVVTLSDNRIGVVCHYSSESLMDRPWIYLITDETTKLLDLMSPEHKDIRILRSEFPEDHNITVSAVLEEARKERASR